MRKIYIIGEDKRQEYLKTLYKDGVVKNIDDADIVILPTPVSKDAKVITGTNIDFVSVIDNLKGKVVFGGKFPQKLLEELQRLNITYYDLMEIEELSIKNAIPTAEGTIFKAIELMNKTIFGANVLILGFGKCGKILADRFRGMKANVFCEARKQKDIAQILALGYNGVDITNLEQILPKMDLIINTIPYMILDKEKIDCINKSAVIIDIASNPGGTDFEYCEHKNITAVLELGIPAKVAPESASSYIKEVIDKIIFKESE